MRRAALLPFVLLMAACPRKPPPRPPPLPPDPKEELQATLKKLYGALEKQEPERLDELLAENVFALGLGPKDVYTYRDTLIEAVRTDLIPFGLRGDVFKTVGSSPKVALSSSQQSGWFYDLPTFEQVRDGKPSKLWKVRLTGHALRGRDQGAETWRIDALHVSFGWPDAELYGPDAARRLKAPEALGTDKGPDTDQVVGLTRRMLDDIAVKIERTSDAAETVLIGTDPKDVFEGGARFKEVARPKLAELKKAVFSVKMEDGPRARVSADRTSGWVAAVVVLKLGKPPRQQVLPSFRALWLFSEEREVWNLVSEHQSVGLPPELRLSVGPDDEVAPAGPDAGR